MENRKFGVLIPSLLLVVGLFFSAQLVYGYEVNTHAYLTAEAIELYNKNTAENKISADLKRFLIDGSIHEDDDPRYRNHFYDPINDAGLSDGLLDGESAKEWANDLVSQGGVEYTLLSDSSLAPVDKEKIEGFYPTSNFAWNEGIRYWLNGDEAMAMEVLGHILHLMEDMGVPEHTRNDSHVKGSKYEEYTARYDSNSPDDQLRSRIGDKKPVSLRSLDKYFDGLAKYSNKYFYSPESIGAYDFPELDFKTAESKNDGWYYFKSKDDEGSQYFLVAQRNLDDIYGTNSANTSVTKDLVMESYWSLLSVRTVHYSAGVIDLFFHDVEKARQDPDFLKEETPKPSIVARASNVVSSIWGGVKSVTVKTGAFFGNVLGAIGNGITSSAKFVGGLFTNDNGLTDVGSVGLESSELDTGSNDEADASAGPNTTTVKKDAATKKNDEIAALKLQIAQLQKEAQVQDKTVLALEKKKPEVVESDAQEVELVKSASSKQLDAPLCPYGSTTKSIQRGVVINEVAWMGGVRSAGDEWIELKNVSSNDVDVSGWQLLNKGGGVKIRLDDLKNSTVKAGQIVLLERTDNNSAVGVTADLIYSGALGNSSDGLHLFDSSCSIVDEIPVAAHWTAGSNDSKQTMERNSGGGWRTSSSVGGTPKKENSAGVTYSNGGGISVSLSSAQSGRGGDSLSIAEPQFYPVTINEIMYDLPGADTNREWIELRNTGSTTVDILDWKLFEGEVNHELAAVQGSSVMSVDGYVIITGSKDEFLKDNAGFTGSILESSFSLNNDGEQLSFKNGTLTIDSTSYASSTGAYGDGASLQLIDGVWVAASSTPGRINSAPIVNVATTTADMYATSSQSIHSADSGGLSVITYYQSLATSTSYTVGSFSVYGSGVAGKWRGGVCAFNPLTLKCSTVLVQAFADRDMPGGDTETLLTFGFNEPVALDAGMLYALFVEPTGSVPAKDRVSHIRGSAADVYLGGKLYAFGQYEPYYINEAIDTGLADMYFAISSIALATTTQVTESSTEDIATTTATTTIMQFYPVIINEAMYDLPGADEGREWIELYNNGTTTVDIAEWKFYENETHHGLTLKQGSPSLLPAGYAVIGNDSTAFLADNSGFTGTLFDSTFSLSNEGEFLVLKNGDLVIDTTMYASATGAQGDGNSLQKFGDVWQAASSTPGMENVMPVVVLEPEPTSTESTTTDFVDSDVVAFPSGPATLSQLNDSIRSTPTVKARYQQVIGKNAISSIKIVRIYGESERAGRWRVGICTDLASCAKTSIAEVYSSEENNVADVKTSMVFDFGNLIALDPAINYVLYFIPPSDALSSVYGAAEYGAYVNGGLTTYVGSEGRDVGVHDMYFEIN
ncbi:TPA: hypothetical protein DDZ49_03815 [Candidatus Wolfebacteria bacterium]|uniref:Phospholipase D/competence protein ComEA helix-hairpin-helix domain protein n=2 Tax=Candidatus Wolfeibacteriota TaxID=1752735 RepID=A0A0G1WI06_9BACT|nr:MAG: endonuclease I [Candidatus Wolfebacteria bacterium GW2011_GWB1_47_1]KKU59870.1 MAG: Phospholipase D/competence protein ComEA helix-hairpin-helix domain protein [Candidatus Wolfebacteria bacterium GW2011_GWE2_47_12]KKU65862.1 MAG: Phospholipase D/competence protein ComEA helix-hairpin-helix domain protein [Candidatus Wolfebacteria bacterium GW2011_GWD2_47_17]KKU89953.1 MAG: Phospholipase D/competence protein ComEA helix-hairpin-helix domain protein [Candidatus Wolfebacteria bacterium GW20